MLKELPVYVVHGPTLVERRERLERELSAHGVTAEWITEPDARELAPELIRRHYRRSRFRWWRRVRATQRIPFRVLSPNEIAVGISHLEAYRRLAASSGDWGLIFEDDAILAADFAERFDDYFAELPIDAEAVFIGSCCGLRIKTVDPGRHFFRKEHPATKCIDSYLLRRDVAADALVAVDPFVVTMDWELNSYFRRRDSAVYWLEPPLVQQGSELGVHPSSLR